MSISSILLMIFGLSLLVIVHESGHYLVARAFGMRVLRFSVGFGKSILEWQPKGSPTVFSIGMVPVLAYVQIDGMNPTEEQDPNDPGLFYNKSLLARMLTIFAGPAANYLLASLIVFVAAQVGLPQSEYAAPVVVSAVGANTPAATAGIQVNDRIVEVNGQAIHNFDELLAATSPRGGLATAYVVERNGQRIAPITLTPRKEGNRGVAGISPKIIHSTKRFSMSEAFAMAVALPYEGTKRNLEGIASLFKKRTTEGLSGPVGLAKALHEQASEGMMSFILALVAISIGLAVFNLLPFPALDGGRLIFLLFELITRKKPNPQYEAVVHGIGLISLLLLVAYVTIFRDLGLG